MFKTCLLITGALASCFALAQQSPNANQSVKKRDSLRVYQTPSVTVTSTRAQERETSATYSEISGAELRRQYTTQDLPAILGELPSIAFYSDNGNNVGYTTLTMRGFDQRRIAVLINGVPQNDPEDHNVYWIDFPDIAANLQSVQVQRGAGMVNYGAAAVGGSVSLTTENFANAKFARFSGGVAWQQYDDANTRFIPIVSRISAEVSSGLTGSYAYYAKLSKISSAGYRDRSQAELGSYFLSAVRFDERVTTQITFYGGPLADGLAYNGLPKNSIYNPALRKANYNYFEYDADSLAAGREVVGYASLRRSMEIENFSQPHFEILNDISLSENIAIKSTVFYYAGDGFYDFDASWADTNVARLTEKYGFKPSGNPRNAIIRANVSNRQGGWIPRIVIRHEDGELTLGAEIRSHRSYHNGQIRYAELLPDNFDSDYKIYEYKGERDIFSLFGREQYDISDELRLTGEFQVVSHRYALDNEKAGGQFTSYRNFAGETVGNGGYLFDVGYTFFNPRIGLNWNPNEKLSCYLALAATSREPRMRNLYAAEDSYFGAVPQFISREVNGVVEYDFSAPLVKPERLLNLEIGLRCRAKTASVGLSCYWMEFTNELVKNGKLDVFGAPVDGNADRSRHLGAELEAAAVIFNDNAYGSLTVSGNATISSNHFVKYSFFAANGASIALDGNSIAGFPDALANIRAEYVLGGVRAGVSMRHIGGMFTDNFGENLLNLRKITPSITDYLDNTIPAATTFNFECSVEVKDFIELKRLRARLSVSNLFNLSYAAGGAGKEFFPAAGRSAYIGIEAEI